LNVKERIACCLPLGYTQEGTIWNHVWDMLEVLSITQTTNWEISC